MCLIFSFKYKFKPEFWVTLKPLTNDFTQSRLSQHCSIYLPVFQSTPTFQTRCWCRFSPRWLAIDDAFLQRLVFQNQKRGAGCSVGKATAVFVQLLHQKRETGVVHCCFEKLKLKEQHHNTRMLFL